MNFQNFIISTYSHIYISIFFFRIYKRIKFITGVTQLFNNLIIFYIIIAMLRENTGLLLVKIKRETNQSRVSKSLIY